MYTVLCVNKTDRKITMAFTGVTTVTDSSSNKVITVGGVAVTIAASEWDLLTTQYIPAAT